MRFDPPIFINVRDRLGPLRDLVAWLEHAGHQRITLLDNASTYGPLIDYLDRTPHRVVYLGENLGARALWLSGLAPTDEPYVNTDPDIVPIEDCPPKAVARLRYLLEAYGAPKVGLGLYLEDVPAHCPHLDWERSLVGIASKQFPVPTGHEIAPGVFRSLVDTTFAIYQPGVPFDLPAIRTGYPFQARHVSPSWYGGALSDEDRHYLEHARRDACHGSSWAAAA